MNYKIHLFDPVTKTERWEKAQGSESSVREKFLLTGCVILSVEKASNQSSARKAGKLILVFCQELKVLLESGLNIVETLEALASRNGKTELDHMYAQLALHVQSGKSLSAALAFYPAWFPDFFVASIQASEQSSGLIDTLGRYISYRETLDILKNKLISAAIYPAIVTATSLLVMVFLVGYVIPRFSVVFAERVEQLPWMTRYLLELGLSISQHSVQWAIGAGLLVLLLIYAVRNPVCKQWMIKKITGWRFVSKTLLQYDMARLYRTLAILLQGGIPFMGAATLATSFNSAALRVQYENALKKIAGGQKISMSFMEESVVDPVTFRILAAGERSGDIAKAFGNMARFIETRLAERIDRLARIIEPLIMLIVGCLIGFIVVLMYSPIFELASSLQ